MWWCRWGRPERRCASCFSRRVVVRRLAAWTVLTGTFVLLAVFAPGVTAFAIGSPPGGFVIPVGSTASFTNIQFSACNSLSWGYQLNGGSNQVKATFPGRCGSGTAPHVTNGPLPPPITLRLFLTHHHLSGVHYPDRPTAPH